MTYDSQSAMADLAYYRNDILSMVNRPSWQNLGNRFDVNGNGRVESRNALAVINELIRRQQFMDLAGLRGDGLPWYDVNGDERGNPQDILAVFSEIRRLAGLPQPRRWPCHWARWPPCRNRRAACWRRWASRARPGALSLDSPTRLITGAVCSSDCPRIRTATRLTC